MSRAEELEAVARALCLIDGVDPESIIDRPGLFPEPAWHSYREQARRELAKGGADAAAAGE
jgi:hypothetical protein